MEYKTEGCRIVVPDSITVRQQLQYSSAISFHEKNDWVEARWRAALPLITEWECELMPDYLDFDLDKSTNPEHSRIIGWVATQVWQHMITLKGIPKK